MWPSTTRPSADGARQRVASEARGGRYLCSTALPVLHPGPARNERMAEGEAGENGCAGGGAGATAGAAYSREIHRAQGHTCEKVYEAEGRSKRHAAERPGGLC